MKTKMVSFTSEELKNDSNIKTKENFNFNPSENIISMNLDHKFLLNQINNMYYFLNKEKIRQKIFMKHSIPLQNFQIQEFCLDRVD